MSTAVMSRSRIQLWGGAAFAVGNLLFLMNKLNEMSRVFLDIRMPDLISGQSLGLIFVGQLALIVGFMAYYRVYAPRVGRWGKLALGMLRAGGITLAIGHITFMTALEPYLPAPLRPFLEYLFVLVLLGVLALFIGLIWFGILNLRRPIVRQWHWLPLLTGLLGLIGFVGFGGEEITAPFLLLRTLFALGLVGMGTVLALEEPQP